MITSSQFFNKTLFDPQDQKLKSQNKQYQFINKIDNINRRKNKGNKNKNQSRNQKSKNNQRSNKNRYSEISGINQKGQSLASQNNNNKSLTQRLSPLQFSLNQLKNTLSQVQQNQSTKFHPQSRRYLSTLQPHHELLNSSLNSVSPWIEQINQSHYNKQRQKIKNLIENYKFQKSLQKNRQIQQTKNYLKTKGNLLNSLEFKRNDAGGSDRNDNSKQKELPSIYDRNKRKNQIKSLDINKSYEDYLNGNHLAIRQISDCKNYNFSTSRSQRRINKQTGRNKDKKICKICQLQRQSKNNIYLSNMDTQTQSNQRSQILHSKLSNQSNKCHHINEHHDIKITQDLKCKNYLHLSQIQINQISKHAEQQISKYPKKSPIFNKQLFKNRNHKKILTLLLSSSRKLLKQQFIHNIHNKKSNQNPQTNNPKSPIKLKFQISGSKTRKLQYQNILQLQTKKQILDNNQYSYYQSIVRSVRSQLDYNQTQKTNQLS